MIARAVRAAIFDVRVYRTLTDDPQFMIHSLIVVLIAAIAFGIGIRNVPIVSFSDAPPTMVVLLAVSTRLTGWVLWAGMAYFIGTIVMRGKAGFRSLLRSLGFASAPGVLAVFFEIPQAGPFLFSISVIWLFAAGLVAIRETQGFDWIRSFVSNAIGWWLAFLIIPGFMLPIAGPETAAL